MKKRTADQLRIDFLETHKWTFWVGYDDPRGGSTTWPIFAGGNIRDAIDRAMEAHAYAVGRVRGSGIPK